MKRVFRFLKAYSAPIAAFSLMMLVFVSAVWLRNGFTRGKGASRPGGAEKAAAPVFSPPAEGTTGMEYSPLLPVFNEKLRLYETHEATDYLCPDGRVLAASDGSVLSISEDERYGLRLILSHPNGAVTEYASLESACVRTGDRVFRGQEIARAGSSAHAEGYSAPHVHFVYREEGKSLPCPFASGSD